MKIVFLGVGEAFDENLPNNSQIVVSGKTNLLVDCGYNIPQQLWKFNPDPNFLDAIYISHQHADHFFGLPAVLLRIWEGGRKRDLTIICQKGLKDSFENFMKTAYSGFMEKFDYKINLVKSEEGKEIEFNDLKFSFSKTIHSGENLAVKITDSKSTYAYSGDGLPQNGIDFYKNLDLLVLETYLYDVEKIGHSSIVSGVEFAKQNNVKCLVLTHINRDLRKNKLVNIKEKLKAENIKIIIPEPLEEYNL